MADEKCCKNCKYCLVEEEYWHDHYLIPEHHYCTLRSKYGREKVEPNGCCENYQSETEQ